MFRRFRVHDAPLGGNPLALHTGLRRGEILRLRCADINSRKHVLIVQKPKAKAWKDRNVNLDSVLRKKLLALFRQKHGE